MMTEFEVLIKVPFQVQHPKSLRINIAKVNVRIACDIEYVCDITVRQGVCFMGDLQHPPPPRKELEKTNRESHLRIVWGVARISAW